MPNWCENQLLIRGQVEEIKRYKDSLLKDETGKYYPLLSTVPLPELKDDSEFDAYLQKEYRKTLWAFGYRATRLEVIENNPEELELHFDTAYAWAQYFGVDLFPKLSILHKYFEPNMSFHGFAHYVKGEVIAQGHEVCEDQLSPGEMYDYKPWPVGVNPSEERLKNYIIIPQDQLRPMEELEEHLKKRSSKCTD